MRKLKNDIKYKINLDEDQKKAKESIYENQLNIITGNAGSGKSLLTAQTALDMIFKKEVEEVFITRAAIEVGKTLGYLRGDLTEKFDPYTEAFMENLYKCYDHAKIEKHVNKGQVKSIPVQFIRGKTIGAGQIMIVEEAQNLSKLEMLAVLTRLGKGGRIVVSGDNNQSDIKDSFTGLHYAIELSKNIPEIKWHKLQANHRSDLVGKILDYEYDKF